MGIIRKGSTKGIQRSFRRVQLVITVFSTTVDWLAEDELCSMLFSYLSRRQVALYLLTG